MVVHSEPPLGSAGAPGDTARRVVRPAGEPACRRRGRGRRGRSALRWGPRLPWRIMSSSADGGYVPPASADRFPPGRVLSAPQAVESFNNFYEFGRRTIRGHRPELSPSPWTIRIDGLVEKPFTIDVADLIDADGAGGAASTGTAASRHGR